MKWKKIVKKKVVQILKNLIRSQVNPAWAPHVSPLLSLFPDGAVDWRLIGADEESGWPSHKRGLHFYPQASSPNPLLFSLSTIVGSRCRLEGVVNRRFKTK